LYFTTQLCNYIKELQNCERTFRKRFSSENRIKTRGIYGRILGINNNLNFRIMSTGRVIAGALVGLAAGAILGILFAPDKGVETRRKIGKKSRDTANDLKDKYNDAVDTVSSKVENWKASGQEALADGANLVEQTKNQIETNLKS
jgi:gas vesicle protein